MIEIYESPNPVNDPDWKSNPLTVEVIFRNGMTKSVTIDTSGMSSDEIWTTKNQILGKQKLIQSIFEHGTHGQITVQGLTVRADDLIAVEIR